MTRKMALRTALKDRGRRHIAVASIGGAVCGILNAVQHNLTRGLAIGIGLAVLLVIINVGEDARRLRKAARVSH